MTDFKLALLAELLAYFSTDDRPLNIREVLKDASPEETAVLADEIVELLANCRTYQ